MSEYVPPEWVRPKAVLQPRYPLIGGGEVVVSEVEAGPSAESTKITFLGVRNGLRQARPLSEVIRQFQPAQEAP